MKIKKEYILIAVIIIGIVFLELLTNNIAEKSVSIINEQFNQIIEDLEIAKQMKENDKLEEVFFNDLKANIKRVWENWDKEEDKLSMFAEHTELDKVSTSLILLEENTKNEQFDDALANAKEFLYKLSNICEKDSLKLKNIF